MTRKEDPARHATHHPQKTQNIKTKQRSCVWGVWEREERGSFWRVREAPPPKSGKGEGKEDGERYHHPKGGGGRLHQPKKGGGKNTATQRERADKNHHLQRMRKVSSTTPKANTGIQTDIFKMMKMTCD